MVDEPTGRTLLAVVNERGSAEDGDATDLEAGFVFFAGSLEAATGEGTVEVESDEGLAGGRDEVEGLLADFERGGGIAKPEGERATWFVAAWRRNKRGQMYDKELVSPEFGNSSQRGKKGRRKRTSKS